MFSSTVDTIASPSYLRKPERTQGARILMVNWMQNIIKDGDREVDKMYPGHF
jgi:hypothetical protein